MHNIVNNLISIQNEIYSKVSAEKKLEKIPKIIAVSKTFSISHILPLINHGHIDFGENKVQEALLKWSDIKNDFTNIKLHMIGKLQSNKVKYALPIFDYIHSLDSLKLAEKISSEQQKINKKVKIFIQVNIGDENQKSGIPKEKIREFTKTCVEDFGLDIIGLMCLPPNNQDSSKYFVLMKELLLKNELLELSMGMSNDYIEATTHNSTFLRIGSKIFGKRD